MWSLSNRLHRWKTDPVAIWVLKQCLKKVLYFGSSISCRLSESFSSVFPSISCQNIHKHVTKFLTQQHFFNTSFHFFSEKLNAFLRNHVILCDFVISLPSLYTPKCNSYCMQFLLYLLAWSAWKYFSMCGLNKVQKRKNITEVPWLVSFLYGKMSLIQDSFVQCTTLLNTFICLS